MKFVAIFALTLATASAFALPAGKLKARNIVVPAGRPEGRISRGSHAQTGQFPYQVGLLLQAAAGDHTWCGGSLLNNKKVLTAAHCVDGIVKAVVYLGSTHRQAAKVTHTVTSSDFIIHPAWDRVNLRNDIAIIDIPYTAYSKNIQPVKIPAIDGSYSTYNGDEVVASGWGRVSDYTTTVASDLQFAHMNVIPNQKCSVYYGSVLRSSNICIATSGGVSTCNGDSGGPLVLKSTKTQIGLTSFGWRYGCEKGVPAVFTRLTSYLEWIKDNAGVSY